MADPDTEVATEAVRDGRCGPLDDEAVRCQMDDVEELWLRKSRRMMRRIDRMATCFFLSSLPQVVYKKGSRLCKDRNTLTYVGVE
jgi:hypothetical protein